MPPSAKCSPRAAAPARSATARASPVSNTTDPTRALIGTGFPFRAVAVLNEYLSEFYAVARATAGIRRAGAASLDLCDVACGRFDAFWEPLLSPWDFAAGALLVREAGGIVSDVEGGAISLHKSSVLAGNPAMHRWLGDTVAAARSEHHSKLEMRAS